jgi:hypothetical protein
MARVKVTFTLDAGTVDLLRQAAERLSKPKSEIVREAIREFHDRIGRLSERERLAKLKLFDELVPLIPRRSPAEVTSELDEIRQSRRAGGRGGRSQKKTS